MSGLQEWYDEVGRYYPPHKTQMGMRRVKYTKQADERPPVITHAALDNGTVNKPRELMRYLRNHLNGKLNEAQYILQRQTSGVPLTQEEIAQEEELEGYIDQIKLKQKTLHAYRTGKIGRDTDKTVDEFLLKWPFFKPTAERTKARGKRQASGEDIMVALTGFATWLTGPNRGQEHDRDQNVLLLRDAELDADDVGFAFIQNVNDFMATMSIEARQARGLEPQVNFYCDMMNRMHTGTGKLNIEAIQFVLLDLLALKSAYVDDQFDLLRRALDYIQATQTPDEEVPLSPAQWKYLRTALLYDFCLHPLNGLRPFPEKLSSFFTADSKMGRIKGLVSFLQEEFMRPSRGLFTNRYYPLFLFEMFISSQLSVDDATISRIFSKGMTNPSGLFVYCAFQAAYGDIGSVEYSNGVLPSKRHMLEALIPVDYLHSKYQQLWPYLGLHYTDFLGWSRVCRSAFRIKNGFQGIEWSGTIWEEYYERVKHVRESWPDAKTRFLGAQDLYDIEFHDWYKQIEEWDTPFQRELDRLIDQRNRDGFIQGIAHENPLFDEDDHVNRRVYFDLSQLLRIPLQFIV